MIFLLHAVQLRLVIKISSASFGWNRSQNWNSRLSVRKLESLGMALFVLCVVVLIECRPVMDRRTDRYRAIAYTASRVSFCGKNHFMGIWILTVCLVLWYYVTTVFNVLQNRCRWMKWQLGIMQLCWNIVERQYLLFQGQRLVFLVLQASMVLHSTSSLPLWCLYVMFISLLYIYSLVSTVYYLYWFLLQTLVVFVYLNFKEIWNCLRYFFNCCVCCLCSLCCYWKLVHSGRNISGLD